jgi:exonuclease VII large subunit
VGHHSFKGVVMSWSQVKHQIKNEITGLEKDLHITQVDLDYWNSHSIQQNEKHFLLFSDSQEEMNAVVMELGKDLIQTLQNINYSIRSLRNRLKIHNSRKDLQVNQEKLVTLSTNFHTVM